MKIGWDPWGPWICLKYSLSCLDVPKRISRFKNNGSLFNIFGFIKLEVIIHNSWFWGQSSSSLATVDSNPSIAFLTVLLEGLLPNHLHTQTSEQILSVSVALRYIERHLLSHPRDHFVWDSSAWFACTLPSVPLAPLVGLLPSSCPYQVPSSGKVPHMSGFLWGCTSSRLFFPSYFALNAHPSGLSFTVLSVEKAPLFVGAF